MSEITRRNFVKGAAMAPLALNAMAQSATVGDTTFDFVVAGAGHNSLITAAYLLRAGYSVVVLEGRPTIGGGCKTAEVCLPGFRTDLCSSVHTFIQSNPVLSRDELGLRAQGLEYIDPDPIMHIPFLDGTSITIWQERGAHDTGNTPNTRTRMPRPFAGCWPSGGNTGPRPLPDGAPAMASVWRRRNAMSSYDLLNELFENEHIRTFHLALGRFSSVPGGEPGTGRFAFNAMTQQVGGRPIPKGGSGELSEALGRVIEAGGGTILTNMPVVELMIEAGTCVGVECNDGSRFRARNGVVSTVHIKHLVNMAPKELWGEEFLENVDLIQPEHAMFAFHYATTEPVVYPLEDGGTITPAESAILSNPERILSYVYEDAAGEINIDGMALQIVVPSVADTTRAPGGNHTLKIEGNLPYHLPEGPEHWDVIKEDVANRVFDYFRQFTTNLTREKILAEFLTTPLDIERWNPAMWRGSTHGFKPGPAQAGDMRPVPGWSDYRMPIGGLYQTGACTNPGGSITGRPGRNAAVAILKDFGQNMEDIVG